MNEINLTTETAISNMIRVLESREFAGSFDDNQRALIRDTIRNHVYQMALMMRDGQLTQNISQTPTATQTQADNLWGENTPKSYL